MKYCAVVFLMCLLSGATLAQPVQKGQADLSAHNFSDLKQVDLSGEWEFNWDKLLEPKDVESAGEPAWITVPGSWHRSDYPRLGVATYRMKLTLRPDQTGLSLYFPIINSSSRIWINNELTGKTGTVSREKASYEPRLTDLILPLPEKVSTFEIVLQAANFTYFSSGLAAAPQIGDTAGIFWYQNRMNGIENFFSGSLIAMFFYQLILFFLYHRGKPHLWLGLICLGMALRSLIVHGGSFLLPNLFPEVSFEIWKKIEFGSVYGVVALFPLYIYDLFRDAAPRKPLYFFVPISIIMCLVVLVTPQYVYGAMLEVCHISLLLAFAYSFYSIAKAWRGGNKDARVILIGVLTCFPLILMEILKNSVLFPVNFGFMYLVEVGLLVFLLFQVYLLANHHAQSYQSLQVLNRDLEKVVEQRTQEMVKANAVKDRLLSVMSHDLKSPLNALQGILKVYNDGAINKGELDTFTRQIESDLGRTNLLVENVLYWTLSQQKGIELKLEKFNLTSVVQENLHLFRSMADRKKLVLHNQAPGVVEVRWDRNILNLVLRNLIANAIKFSYEGGEISIVVTPGGRNHTIAVSDQGIGMNEILLKNLLSPNRMSSSNGTGDEKGTGLGLSLCREYLVKAGASLTVDSTEGKGSTFTVSIPA